MHAHSLSRRCFALLLLSIGANLQAQTPTDDEPLPPGAIARLGTTRFVHLGGLSSVAVSPDGKIVASGVSEGKRVNLSEAAPAKDKDRADVWVTKSILRLWDAKTGKVIREIATPDAPVSAMSFQSGDCLIARCGRYLCAFDVAKGQALWQLELKIRQELGREAVAQSVVATSDKIITVFRGDIGCAPWQHAIRIWDAKNRKPVTLARALESTTKAGKRIPKLLSDVVVSGDGRFAAINICEAERDERQRDGFGLSSPGDGWKYSNQRTELIDLTTGNIVSTIPGEKSSFRNVRFSDNGETLAFTREKEIYLVQTTTGKRRLLCEAPDWPHGLTFISARRLAASVWNDKIRAWDVATGKEVDAPFAEEHYLNSSRGGNTRAAIHSNVIECAAADSGKPVLPFAGHRRTPLIRYSFAKANTLISCDCERALLWNTRSGAAEGTLAMPLEYSTVSQWRDRHWDVDREISVEKQFVVRETKAGLELRDAKTGQRIRGLETSGEPYYWRQFSAMGNRLVASTKGRFDIIDVASSKQISSIEWGEGRGGLLSPKGKYFARPMTFTKIEIFDADSGNSLRKIGAASDRRGKEYVDIRSFQFSADERSIIGEIQEEDEADEYGVRRACIGVWDVGTGRLDRVFTFGRVEVASRETNLSYIPDGIHVMALSPDGRLIAVAPTNSPIVEIWEVASGLKRGEFKGHSGAVVDVAFSPDGKQLASSSEDTTILIWDLTRPLQPAKLKDRLATDELAANVKTLYQPDASKADAAIWSLIHAAPDSVPFLKKHLRPAPRPDAKIVERLLRDLDRGDFRVRSKAERDLESFGELALGDIESALKQNNSVECKRRLEGLLQKAQKQAEPFGTNERTGQWRVIEVLEKIGTPAAIEHLRELAAGASGARLTIAARAALSRMEAKGKAKE